MKNIRKTEYVQLIISKNEELRRIVEYDNNCLVITETKKSSAKKKNFVPYNSTLEYKLSETSSQMLLKHFGIKSTKRDVAYLLMEIYVKDSFTSLQQLLTKYRIPAQVKYTYVRGNYKTTLQL